jgi:hypothetical protein
MVFLCSTRWTTDSLRGSGQNRSGNPWLDSGAASGRPLEQAKLVRIQFSMSAEVFGQHVELARGPIEVPWANWPFRQR